MSEPQCRLLGPFSLLIQSVLGLLSLSSLLYKRYKEYPNRRPWKVWYFDVSKQVIGGIGVHFLNLLLSVIGGTTAIAEPDGLPVNIEPFQLKSQRFIKSQTYGVSTIAFYLRDNVNDISNPCNWYFLNILFDTTIGVPILWGLLSIIFKLAKSVKIKGIDSGDYGNPPKYSSYFKQLGLYFMGIVSMKLIVYILLIAIPIFEIFANWLLSIFNPFPRLQIFIVTFVTPLVMNSLQYILIDNIIQSSEYKKSKKNIRIPKDTETLFNNDDENFKP